MGFMGLSHWVESDSAADARYVLQQIVQGKTKKSLRAFFKNELNDNGNQYNTDGVTNVALILEDEGQRGSDDEDPKDFTPMVSELMTKKEFTYLINSLTLYVNHYKKNPQSEDELKDPWKTNFLKSFQRLLSSATKKFNKRFNNETSNSRKSKLQRLRPSRKVS